MQSICDLQAQCESIQELIIQKKRQRIKEEYEDKLEALRVEEILLHISVRGRFPDGMNGYNRQTKRFVRWLPGYNEPVSMSIAKGYQFPDQWFVDSALNVQLHWHPDGYYEMRSRDSARFIEENSKRVGFSFGEELGEVNVAKVSVPESNHYRAMSSPDDSGVSDEDTNSPVGKNPLRALADQLNEQYPLRLASRSSQSSRCSAGAGAGVGDDVLPARKTAVADGEEEEENVVRRGRNSSGPSSSGGDRGGRWSSCLTYCDDENTDSSSSGSGDSGDDSDGDELTSVHSVAVRKAGRQSQWTPQMVHAFIIFLCTKFHPCLFLGKYRFYRAF